MNAWQAGPAAIRVELDRGGKLNALTRPMWEALGAVLDGAGDATLLVTSADAKAFSAGADVRALADRPAAEKRSFLQLEYETLERLRERQAPTVAVADGLAYGAGAGVFMACAERVVTEKGALAMPECRIGLVPDAGALHFLTAHCEPAVARYLALTGLPLNARDMVDAGLATRYVPRKEGQLEPLYAELAAAPSSSIDAALDRRGAPAPGRLASGLFSDATLASVRAVFGDTGHTAGVAARLEDARTEARRVVGSCGWATREAAEGVLDVLDAAADGLSRGCPTALAATLVALERQLADGTARHGARAMLRRNIIALADVASSTRAGPHSRETSG